MPVTEELYNRKLQEEEMADTEKPNCYQCKHRGEVPGSAHSRCSHPANGKSLADPLANIMAIFASVGRVPPIQTGGLAVRGNPDGIKKGWFNYPHNFDPVWLEECDGFEPREPDAS